MVSTYFSAQCTGEKRYSLICEGVVLFLFWFYRGILCPNFTGWLRAWRTLGQLAILVFLDKFTCTGIQVEFTVL